MKLDVDVMYLPILACFLPFILAAPAPSDANPLTCSPDKTGFFNSPSTVLQLCAPGTTCDSTIVYGNPCVPPAVAPVATTTPAGVSTAVPSLTTYTSSGTVYTSTIAGAVTPVATPTLTTYTSSGTVYTSTVSAAVSTSTLGSRYVAYWSIYELGGSPPTAQQLAGMTHVILAFANMTTMTKFLATNDPATQGVFGVSTVQYFKGINPNIKVMGSFGGWGFGSNFTAIIGSDTSRSQFALQIKQFVETFQLDGVDFDWEYPVGNGDVSGPLHPEQAYEFADLLAQTKKQLALVRQQPQLISVAVPSRIGAGSAVAYNSSTVPAMDVSVDFWNVMSYDYANRDDSRTDHQAGGYVAAIDIPACTSYGIKPAKLNLGFPLYSKWFKLTGAQATTCAAASSPIGCPMGPFVDASGNDNFNSGWWRFGKEANNLWFNGVQTVNSTLLPSWNTAVAATGTENSTAIASAYYDKAGQFFWTWLSPSDMKQTCKTYLPQVGGVMVWSLNQDDNTAAGGPHLDALAQCISGT